MTAASSVKIHSRKHQNASYIMFFNEKLTEAVEVYNGTVQIPSVVGTTGAIAMVSLVTK